MQVTRWGRAALAKYLFVVYTLVSSVLALTPPFGRGPKQDPPEGECEIVGASISRIGGYPTLCPVTRFATGARGLGRDRPVAMVRFRGYVWLKEKKSEHFVTRMVAEPSVRTTPRLCV